MKMFFLKLVLSHSGCVRLGVGHEAYMRSNRQNFFLNLLGNSRFDNQAARGTDLFNSNTSLRFRQKDRSSDLMAVSSLLG